MLTAEHEDRVAIHFVVDEFGLVGRQRFAQIEAFDFGADVAGQFADADCHRFLLQGAVATGVQSVEPTTPYSVRRYYTF
jgi:hypothetical protein